MEPDAVREVKSLVDPGRAFRRHIHDELFVAQVWRGSTQAWFDGEEVTVSGDCIVLIPPGVVHACNPVPASGWSYTLALLDPGAGGFHGGRCRVLPSTGRLRTLFAALRGGQGMAASVILAALEDVVNGHGQAGDGSGASARPQALRRAMAHLRANLDAPLGLEALCAVAGLSKYYLVRAFKRAYGLSPHAFHVNLRVNEAKARLRQGQEPADVALGCGFCDQSHLTRVFSRCVGMTPAAYQRAMAIPSKTPPLARL